MTDPRLDEGSGGEAALISDIETARRVRAQDVQESADGTPVLRQGVARDRVVSVEDPERRHGRKSRRYRFDGYKRHVLKDLDSGLVRAVGITAANALLRPASPMPYVPTLADSGCALKSCT